MSTNETNVEKVTKIAADVIYRADLRGKLRSETIAKELDAAGLLVSPLHVRALESVEVLARRFEYAPIFEGHVVSAAIKVGRESLASKKPKVRPEDEVVAELRLLWGGVGPENKLPGRVTQLLDELISLEPTS